MMEEVVDIVNQLQDVVLTGCYSGLKLPQIVVVGSQSAGKSSVLEQIVGKSFLPRGTGIVTRCPLVLQLVKAPADTEEYAIFQHDNTKQFKDYDLIRKEIEEQTVKLAGGTKDICRNSINLKIYSPSLLDLTLVDLPGLMKVPVGDQPEDIEEQTKDLIMEYIENPNSIILAVTPANVDMATSDSLKLAKEVDPEGARTLAVLTKLDLMDEGTDAWDMLNGKVIPVKLGIIGVVNRSQKDINNDKTITENIKEEAEFFRKNYGSIAVVHGSPYLARTVQSILVNHIKKCLPDLKKKIKQKLKAKNNELSHVAKSSYDNQTLLLNLLIKFTDLYTSSLNGSSKKNLADCLNGGARVLSVFKNSFYTDLSEIDPLHGIEKNSIMIAIANSNGLNPEILVPQAAFKPLVKMQIKQFLAPSLKSAELVYNELYDIAQICLADESLQLERYPKLHDVLYDVVTELLLSRLLITNISVEDFIDYERAYINTDHPDFSLKQDKTIKVVNVAHSTQNLTLTIPLSEQYGSTTNDEDKVNYALMKGLIKSYMMTVKNGVKDHVPKIIMHRMVNFVLDKMLEELMAKIFNKRTCDDLLFELPEITKKRNELEAEILELEKAEEIVRNVSTKTYKQIKY